MILKKIAISITTLIIASACIMPAFASTEAHKGDWSGTTGISTFNPQVVERISKEDFKNASDVYPGKSLQSVDSHPIESSVFIF